MDILSHQRTAHIASQFLHGGLAAAVAVSVSPLDLACSDRRNLYNRSHPYVLDRDLTIRSSEPPELGQMDFVFLTRKVLLAPNVTLTLDGLVLRNINKLGGFGLDFFMVSVQ